MKYKDQQNKVHDIQDGFQYLMAGWPVGYTEISEQDAILLLNSSQQPIVIQQVTMRQARLALLQAGHLANVEASIAAMVGISGDAARITWEFSSTVERNNPLIAQLGTALNLTETQLNDLFTLAATK